MKLNIPYKSQWDAEGSLTKNDCGPACVSMILGYYGISALINEVFKKTEAGQGMITIAQLQKAISSYGYESYFDIGKSWDDCRNLLKQNIPPILLIHYGPLSSRQDNGFSGGHFIVLTGEDKDCWLCHDPDFQGQYRSHGEHHRYLKEEMERAWAWCYKDGNPNYSFLVIKPKPKTSENYYKTLDLTNVESMKVAVDIWYSVIKLKEYIKVSDHEKEVNKLSERVVKLEPKAGNWDKILELYSVKSLEELTNYVTSLQNSSNCDELLNKQEAKFVKKADDLKGDYEIKIDELRKQIISPDDLTKYQLFMLFFGTKWDKVKGGE